MGGWCGPRVCYTRSMGARGAGWTVLVWVALLATGLGCSRSGSAPEIQRIGVPPDMVGLFEGRKPPDAPPIRVVGLRPYERARDLEVLLFSSGSPVFTGVLVPGRWLPVLGPWARRLDGSWL